MNILDLPEIVAADTAERLLLNRNSILGAAGNLLLSGNGPTEQIILASEALELITVLEYVHAPQSFENEAPAYAAEQLKLHFLSILEYITNLEGSPS